ncbi:MAG: hypothetical protein ACKVIR_02580 [Candidatus Poseidoniales archaeon]|jgi:hypothetical protein
MKEYGCEEIEWFLEEIGEKIDFDVHDGIANVVESGWSQLVGKDQVDPVARMVGLDMTTGDSPL